MLATRKKMALLATLTLLLGLTAVGPAGAVGELYGGVSCFERDEGSRICGIGVIQIGPGAPGSGSTISATFTCHAVSIGTGVATRVAPIADGGCILHQGDIEDPDHEAKPVVGVAPGIGAGAPTVATGSETENPDNGTPFIPNTGGFAVCWHVGAIFVDGSDGTTSGCDDDLLDQNDLLLLTG